MEKKKLLLVAISVGIFLIIVIGFSILIFAPKKAASVAAPRPIQSGTSGVAAGSSPGGTERTQPATVDAVDMIRNREGVQGLQSPPSTGTPGDVYVYGEYSGESGAGAKTSGNNATNLVIEVPKPGTPPVGRTESKPQTTASKQPASVASTTPKSTVVKAEPKPQTTTLVKPQQASVASKSPAPAAIKATVQQGKHDNNYWVQTGAFSTQVRAEGVKEILSAKGIAAIIENGDVNGRDVFRVRVGPYTSPNEADYWLTLIRAINGFEDSQVRISQSLR